MSSSRVQLDEKLSSRANLIQNSPTVKKVCGPQEGHCEKNCEIQGGGQEWL